MSPEQKTKIDAASNDELWRLLATPSEDGVKPAYIRDRIALQAHAETLRKLDDVTRRLQQVEFATSPSGMSTLTFWLALTAVAFSSFSVPWDDVEEKITLWSQQAQKALQTQPVKRNIRAETTPPPARHHEPELPVDPSSPLSDALLLLPHINAQPVALP